jgi:16S rRNA (guanine966-N2)-methyltransferase
LHVVAGEAKGVPLVAPRDARPTTGRVREALFSSLGDLTATSVLDLYAGSGALGIEALSRGADRAVLVDDDRAAVDAIDTNLAATRLGDAARVVKASVSTFLHGGAPAEAPFDLVLADPPYGSAAETVTDLLAALTAPGWLAPDARVVIERAARDPFPTVGMPWSVGWERKYGDTLVVVLRASA